MKIALDDYGRELEQGSCAWLEARAGLPTASEFDALVSPLWKIRTGEGPETYLATKLAEKWGGPLPQFTAFAMEQGNVLEEQAIPFFEFTTGLTVRKVGLCLTDDGRAGCSPDGLIGEDGGIECKCPTSPKHVKYLLNGELPPDYKAQVHGSLYVTGRKWWKFLSYRRHFPPLILTIERDEKICAQIGQALSEFNEKFDAGWKLLLEKNGGEPPPKRQPMVFASDLREQFVSETPS